MSNFDELFKKALSENADLLIEADKILKEMPIKSEEDLCKILSEVSKKYSTFIDNIKEKYPDVYEKLCKNKTF